MSHVTFDRCLAAAAAALVDFVLPQACLACGCMVSLVREYEPSLGLCRACGALLKDACGDLHQRQRAVDRLLVLWDYAPPLVSVIHGLKFGGLQYLGEELAQRAHESVAAVEESTGSFDLVVAVPLHWRRSLRRGFNQAAAIAEPLAKRMGCPCGRPLRRVRRTARQTGLQRAQRLKNPRLAFRVRPRADVLGQRILLVDDVVTTGATLEACGRVLRRAGARRVDALAVARTPEVGTDIGISALGAGHMT